MEAQTKGCVIDPAYVNKIATDFGRAYLGLFYDVALL
jgi:hypothetical protein